METMATTMQHSGARPTARMAAGALPVPWREPGPTEGPALQTECEALLAEACARGVLDPPSPAAWAAFAEAATRRRVTAGTLLLSREQPAQGLWLMASGLAALGTRGDHGLLQHRCSVGAGSWLDLASGLRGTLQAEDAVAETDCVLWHWPLPAVQRVVRQHPDILSALLSTLAAEVQSLIEGTRGLMMKCVLARCATWLLAHAQLDDATALTATLRLQQRKRTIALQLGTTAETFSRTLHQLRRQNLIEVHGYDIRLLDVPGLRQVADPPR
ncbi:Crp/Fnr family transcriptional regulator [Aquabacterium sp.]|uniref:Crp/Fnr family transcriptional regulator n=1 Tax=Aquabacterium sp. TaxID=1872578 RepID=UPI003783DBC6